MESSKPFHFTPHNVSEMTGASVQTVRRWTDLFAAQLSASTQEKPRLYTWADVELLKQIKLLRDANVPVELIAARLPSPSVSPSTISEIATLEPQGSVTMPDSSLIVVLETMNALQRRVEAMEGSRKDYVQGIAVGFVGALLFVILLLLLALLYGG